MHLFKWQKSLFWGGGVYYRFIVIFLNCHFLGRRNDWPSGKMDFCLFSKGKLKFFIKFIIFFLLFCLFPSYLPKNVFLAALWKGKMMNGKKMKYDGKERINGRDDGREDWMRR